MIGRLLESVFHVQLFNSTINSFWALQVTLSDTEMCLISICFYWNIIGENRRTASNESVRTIGLTKLSFLRFVKYDNDLSCWLKPTSHCYATRWIFSSSTELINIIHLAQKMHLLMLDYTLISIYKMVFFGIAHHWSWISTAERGISRTYDYSTQMN